MHLNKGYYDKENDEYIQILYDNKTEKWSLNKEKRPTVNAYITNKTPQYIREFVYAKDCKKITVPAKNREYAYADHLQLSRFKDDVREKRYKKSMVYLHPGLYGADFDVTDQKLMEFVLKENEVTAKEGKDVKFDNIYQAYFDIETDVPMSSERSGQAIYMTTTFFEKTNEMYLDFLINPKYKKCETILGDNSVENVMKAPMNEVIDFSKHLSVQKWIREIKDNFIKEVRNNETFMKMKISQDFIDILENSTYIVRGYLNEATLIRSAWQRIMLDKRPNYLQIFNANFDVSCCYMRYIALGKDPKDLFTDPRIGEWYELYCEDVRKYNGTYRRPKEPEMHPCNEPQWYHTPTCTSIQDTAVLIYSYNIKKQNSYSLEATANREVGFGKLDYAVAGLNIFNLPYVNFTLAAEYCIRDTFVLKAVEMKTGAMLASLIKRYTMVTEFDRLHVSMDYCTNIFNVDMVQNGEVQRNAINKYLLQHDRKVFENLGNPLWLNLYDAASVKGGITGGYVADPNKLKREGKVIFKRIKNTKIHKRCVDLDAKAHYPSAIASNNIGLESLIGQITHIEPLSEELKDPQKNWLEKIKNPVFTAMKLINRDIVGIGELFNLHSLENLVELHYGISCNWKESPVNQEAIHIMKNGCDPFIKYIKKIFNDRFNTIDLNSGRLSLNGYIPCSQTGSISLRYYGTLINIDVKNQDGTPCDTCDLVIENYDKETDYAFVSLNNIKDDGKVLLRTEAVVNRNPEFLSYFTPRNTFDSFKMNLHASSQLSHETIEKIISL